MLIQAIEYEALGADTRQWQENALAALRTDADAELARNYLIQPAMVGSLQRLILGAATDYSCSQAGQKARRLRRCG
jgi:hypothetical protein